MDESCYGYRMAGIHNGFISAYRTFYCWSSAIRGRNICRSSNNPDNVLRFRARYSLLSKTVSLWLSSIYNPGSKVALNIADMHRSCILRWYKSLGNSMLGAIFFFMCSTKKVRLTNKKGARLKLPARCICCFY